MQWKTITGILFIVLIILFLNSLYPIFEVFKFAVFASVPLLILTWLILIFIRNKIIIQKLTYITIGYSMYISLVYLGFQFHNYSWIRKYQADKTIEILQVHKQIHGNYPKDLTSLPVNYIPWTAPSYNTDSARKEYYLFYDVGIFEDATFSSKQNIWIYGD